METGHNLLAGETSPYLLQHAHNPVHWRPWGPEALAEARRRDCPILLSIGYAACHWCHVMAHESFENEDIAKRMNELFVNVKVYREERPDIDHIYMTALHAMDQQGGWPLTMFLDPDGQPMYGGTYWPPEPRWGRPSFRQILEGVDSAWRTRRTAMEQNGAALFDHVARLSAPSPGRALTADDLTKVGDGLLRAVDPVHGGIGGAPKVPNAPIFRFFWNEMFRRKDPRFGETVGVRRRLKRGGTAFLVVHQLDGTFACLPAWMTEEAASRFEIGDEPRFPLDALRSLRNEVDALLGFLASESKPERPENDAPIQKSPAKPVRGRATVRRTACSSKERAREGRRGAAARDRDSAGTGGNGRRR